MNRMLVYTMVGASLLAAAPTAMAQTAAQELQGFSITLVIGDLQGSTTADNVPATARRALSDMKDFLPYKSYRLVDTGWILGTVGRGANTRLGGPANEQYGVTVIPNNRAGASGPMNLHFALTHTETQSAESRRQAVERQIAQQRVTRANAETQLAKAVEQYGENHPKRLEAQRRLAEIDQRIAALESGEGPTTRTVTIIDTTFTMNVGETVVVGTSRVQGDKALIALLTAVPRGK